MTIDQTTNMKRASRYLASLGACIFAVLAISGPAIAVDPENPDWPCIQRKVLSLTAGVMWDGPTVAKDAPWRNSNEIRQVVKVLMSRRVPIEDAEKAIEDFSKTLPTGKKDEQLTLLFAGMLDQTNARRTKIVKGIEKIQIRQTARAKELERQSSILAKLQDRASGGEKGLSGKIAKAEKAYEWDARVFKERQQNIPLACEIPVLIEQRAYSVARAIRNSMSN